jgi:hypothetical protein
MFRVTSSQGLCGRSRALSPAHGKRWRKQLHGITRDIRHADLRAIQSGLRNMKANIATMRGLGGGSSQSAADR